MSRKPQRLSIRQQINLVVEMLDSTDKVWNDYIYKLQMHGNIGAALEEAGYQRVKDLQSLSINGLHSIKGIGTKHIQALIKACRQEGVLFRCLFGKQFNILLQKATKERTTNGK